MAETAPSKKPGEVGLRDADAVLWGAVRGELSDELLGQYCAPDASDDDMKAVWKELGFRESLWFRLCALARKSYPQKDQLLLPARGNLLERLRAAAEIPALRAAWGLVPKDPEQLATCRELDAKGRQMFPDFVSREASDATLLRHFIKRFEAIDTKSDPLHAATAGAPGTGKTRFVDEVCDWNKLSEDELRSKANVEKLPDGFAQSVQNWVQIRISYNGYSPAKGTDYEYPVHGFLCRVACAYLFSSCNLAAVTKAVVESGVLGATPDEEALVVCIANDHASRHHIVGRVAVFLGVDELLLIDKDSDERMSQHTNAGMITKLIGKLVESEHVLVYQLTTTLRDTLLADASKTQSGRQIFWVPLLPLSSLGILKMFKRYEDGIPGHPKLLPRLLKEKFFRQLLSDCGGHPRTLECALKVAIDLANQDPVLQTATEAYARVKHKLGSMADIPFELMSAVLLGIKVNARSMVNGTMPPTPYGHYVFSGMLSNSIESIDDTYKDQFIPRLPIIKIVLWAEQHLCDPNKRTREYEVARTLHYMLRGEQEWTWKSYERFHAGWEHLMDVLLAGKTVYLWESTRF